MRTSTVARLGQCSGMTPDESYSQRGGYLRRMTRQTTMSTTTTAIVIQRSLLPPAGVEGDQFAPPRDATHGGYALAQTLGASDRGRSPGPVFRNDTWRKGCTSPSTFDR
jgi:hypothetical protein